jgi:hypothetical protein
MRTSLAGGGACSVAIWAAKGVGAAPGLVAVDMFAVVLGIVLSVSGRLIC